MKSRIFLLSKNTEFKTHLIDWIKSFHSENLWFEFDSLNDLYTQEQFSLNDMLITDNDFYFECIEETNDWSKWGVLQKLINRKLFLVVIDSSLSASQALNLLNYGSFFVFAQNESWREIFTSLKPLMRMRELATIYEQHLKVSSKIPTNILLNHQILENTDVERVYLKAMQLAKSKTSIIIVSESGTGKEHLVKCIHEHSGRTGELVNINCGAIPSEYFDKTFFGYSNRRRISPRTTERGYFELADNGTIFLDEIGNLKLEHQAKLLRVLETGEIQRTGEVTPRKIDLRIIATTNSNLEDAIAKSLFREDLYHRLKGAVLTLPPLRERSTKEKLAYIRHFISEFNSEFKRENDKAFVDFDNEARSLLIMYNFPGNLREMKNIIYECCNLSSSKIIPKELLPSEVLNYNGLAHH